MTPATSVTFFKPEFGDFLYAPIGNGVGDMPTTVMSALARLDLDPWQEASELTELSIADAIVRLSNLLAKLPQAQRSLVNSKSFIGGLIGLLPRHLQTAVAIPSFKRPALPALPTAVPARMLIFAVLAVGIIVATAASQYAWKHLLIDEHLPSSSAPSSGPAPARAH